MRTPIRSLVGLPLFALLASGCGGSPSPEAPPAPLTPPPPATTSTAGETAAPPLSPEEAKKAEEAKQLEKDYATLEKEAAAEKARLGSDEMKKAVTALTGGVYAKSSDAIKTALSSKHRQAESAPRDAHRHPVETLEFLGFRQNQTVLEIGPGEGWYTELLAPALAKSGKLYVTIGDVNGPRTERSTFYALRTKALLESSPELYGKVEALPANPPDFRLGIDGKTDLVLLIRGFHGMVNRGQVEPWLASIHAALKPGGTLGIIQHRAAEGSDPKETSKKGYVPEKYVIDLVTANGFELAGKSEINKNEKDTRDHPEGVWSLPPTLREGDKNRDKYVAIGESDRMTLKFKRVEKKK